MFFATLTPALSRKREREPNWAAGIHPLSPWERARVREAGIRALSSMERDSGPLSLWEMESGSLSLRERARVRVIALSQTLTPTLSRKRERELSALSTWERVRVREAGSTTPTLASLFIPSPPGRGPG
jgi:hypothetical protein